MSTAYIFFQHTNQSAKYSQIVEFLVVKIADNDNYTFLHSLVKPIKVLTAREEKTLGIKQSELRSKPPLIEIIPDLVDFIKDARVILYNSNDARILKSKFREIGLPTNFQKNYIVDMFSKNLRKLSVFKLSQQQESVAQEKKFKTSCTQLIDAIYGMDSMVTYGDTHNAFAKAKKELSSDITTVLDKATTLSGVYIFRDDNDKVVYVVKGKNVRQRLKSHLLRNNLNSKRILDYAHSLEVIPTGNELIALLVEAEMIYELQPRFNTQIKKQIAPWTITSKTDSKGILRIRAEKRSYSDLSDGLLFNKESVLVKLKEIRLLYNLCPKYIGLERTAGSCSDTRCSGICKGNEDSEIYNARVKQAMGYLKSKLESYFLKLKGRDANEDAFLLIINNLYCGYGFIPKQSQISTIEDIEAFIVPQRHTYFSSRSISTYVRYKRVEKNYI